MFERYLATKEDVAATWTFVAVEGLDPTDDDGMLWILQDFADRVFKPLTDQQIVAGYKAMNAVFDKPVPTADVVAAFRNAADLQFNPTDSPWRPGSKPPFLRGDYVLELVAVHHGSGDNKYEFRIVKYSRDGVWSEGQPLFWMSFPPLPEATPE